VQGVPDLLLITSLNRGIVPDLYSAWSTTGVSATSLSAHSAAVAEAAGLALGLAARLAAAFGDGCTAAPNAGTDGDGLVLGDRSGAGTHGSSNVHKWDRWGVGDFVLAAAARWFEDPFCPVDRHPANNTRISNTGAATTALRRQ
jgi:hypothetical protein